MISAQQIAGDVFGPVTPVRFSLQPEVLAVRCQFDVSHYDDALFGHYGISMPSQLWQAVPKRRCEYLAGRMLFQQLLHHYQLPSCQLLNTLSGAPSWPAGYIGSVSHADGNAICCMIPEKIYQTIGIDIETVLNADNCTELASHIVQPKEQHLLLRTTVITYAEALTIAFSAKESLYKALYPKVQRFFGFEDAELIKIQTDTQQFTLRLTTDLTPQLTMGMLFHGHYRFVEKQVISLIALPSC
ncbi:MAG: 4-phosphopantetheinyl transferase [Gammaproteobacteria bacterium HGW-Gammaproteobacteria-15]|nr:MAG: 4-phosphopantetheinyl transferase [Gammaproteobacteria bacterium HGW-Gammaproteobacteria-15]